MTDDPQPDKPRHGTKPRRENGGPPESDDGDGSGERRRVGERLPGAERGAGERIPDQPEAADSTTLGADEPSPPDSLLVVALGASAGGLKPLLAFFEAMPTGHPIAFVVIQHSDPGAASLLPEILQRQTELRVVLVEEGQELEPGVVYVSRPDRWSRLEGSRIEVVERGEREHQIDRFFDSLAETRGRRGIAVVLSGSGSDGTSGVRRVKERGGMVMAQDPEGAEHTPMPRNAIASGAVDLVLAPEEMPQTLLRYAAHSYVRATPEAVPEEPAALNQVLALLRIRTGRDFHHYRKPTLLRRMQRRMGLRQVEDAYSYAQLLRQDPDEVEALVRDFMINVSSFFRDADAWTELRKEAVVELVRAAKPGRPLRVWVPACATGEEAYSVAMLLLEVAEEEGVELELKVFASDVVEDVLHSARSGIYPAAVAEEISRPRLDRYFEKEGPDGYRVTRRLRETVVFASHDLMNHPPFSRLDLVSCRNLLIYLKPEVQAKVLALLHFALREGGYLFLGSAETVGEQQGLFEPVSKKHRIFRRLGPTRHELVDFPLHPATDDRLARKLRNPGSEEQTRVAYQVRRALVHRFAPGAVLVDRRQQVLYLHGDTDPYLRAPAGEPTRDFLPLVRETLRSRVRGVLHRALGEHEEATTEASLTGQGEERRVLVTASPLEDPAATVLVTFEEQPSAATPGRGPEAAREVVADRDARLEDELRHTQEELRSAVEELESSNEELKASNEEISSMNEELQSTNEELQSLNEELETVNGQLQAKLAELEDANNDLANLLNSTDIATLFLDRRFHIRRFTPAIRRLLDVLPSDVGRPLENLAPKFRDDALLEDAQEVLDRLVPREREIEGGDRTYIRRIVPYRTEADRIDGVVVTFTDISERIEVEEELARLNHDLEAEVEERTRQVRLLRDTALVANRSSTLSEAVGEILERVGSTNGWHAGRAFHVDAAGRPELVGEVWIDGEQAAPSRLADTLADPASLRAGGLVERVLEGGQPAWGPAGEGEVAEPAASFETALAFSVKVRERIVGVLELFSFESFEPQPSQLSVLHDVGIQLGRLAEREEAQTRLEELGRREHERIGAELHDLLGSQVTGIAMLAENIRETLAGESSDQAEALAKVVEELESLHAQIRSLSWALVSVQVDAEGLESVLRRLCVEMGEMGAPCDLEVQPSLRIDDERKATAVFRVAREAIHNAIRHADPNRIGVRLWKEGESLCLEVRDDGKGMERVPWGEGVGLSIMAKRAASAGGSLAIESVPGEGTTVLLRVPLGGDPASGTAVEEDGEGSLE